MSNEAPKCPVCGWSSSEVKKSDYDELLHVDCPKCGKFEITRSVQGMLAGLVTGGMRTEKHNAALLSHAIRNHQGKNERLSIDTGNIEALLKQKLPAPKEQGDNLIHWIGRNCENNAGLVFRVAAEPIASIIGAADGGGTFYVIRELQKNGLINIDASGDGISLTFDGWERFNELTRATVDSLQAFMAMPFGDELLDNIFENYWKPAVEATGFNLHRLTDKQRAGLIDDRLRVEIRRSRFLISEITGQNRGAYWEAGFAEGLDRPVIYTCKKSEFKKAHFDTNHCLTILWEEDKLDNATEELKACIRETLPNEAVITDSDLD